MVVLIGGSVSEPRGSDRGLRHLRCPLPPQLLRLGNLGWDHLSGETIMKPGSFLFSVRSNQVEPLMGLDIVLRDASPADYITPRLTCAPAWPCSAALRYHFAAS